MGFFEKVANIFPEVRGPSEKRLGFKTKLKWTLLILVAFFVLSVIPLYGLGQNALSQFESLSLYLIKFLNTALVSLDAFRLETVFVKLTKESTAA